MKIAVQTILWGSRPREIRSVLHSARTAGFDGVEIFQHPSQLLNSAGAAAFYDMLVSESNLIFVGATGGSIEERVAFVQLFEEEQARRRAQHQRVGQFAPEIARNRPYVYVDTAEDLRLWDRSTPPVRFALHPHMFRSVQTLADARELLQRHRWLEFLPDTAHLKIAGERIVEGIEEFFGRLAAVHLKDWTPEFGRSYQFYGRGFAELGRGDVELRKVLELLRTRNFTGWVVVEKDFALNPDQTALQSRLWLRAQDK